MTLYDALRKDRDAITTFSPPFSLPFFHCSSQIFYDCVFSSMKPLDHDVCVMYCSYGDSQRPFPGDYTFLYLTATKWSRSSGFPPLR